MSLPFFTLIDPNARVKGARDPLGVLSVWTSVGRGVVTNLTTQTTSLNDFRVLIIGAWLMDESRGAAPRETDPFLVWEQLAAYARHPTGERFRGVERTTRNLLEKNVTVSPAPMHQILTGQRAYGVWGLYSAAAKRCSLLGEGSEAQPYVQGAALSLMESRYLPLLEAGGWSQGAHQLKKTVRAGKTFKPGGLTSQLDAIRACLSRAPVKAERLLFRETLVEGGSGSNGERSMPAQMQAALATLMTRLKVTQAVGASESHRLMAAAERERGPVFERLAGRLQLIRDAESVLAPSVYLFSLLCQQEHRTLAQVAALIRSHWDVPVVSRATTERLHRAHLDEGLIVAPAQLDGLGRDRWLTIADALNGADYEHVLTLLVEQNRYVSQARGGSAGWLDLDHQQRLVVRMQETPMRLPSSEDIDDLWVHPYFLPSLATISHQVGAA